MSFKIVRGSTVEQLEKSVSEYLSQGWSLHGQVFRGPDTGPTSYHQAMTKKGANDED